MKKLSQTKKPLTITITTVANLIASADLPQVVGGSLLSRIDRTRFSGGTSCNNSNC